ncbi:ABC transporter permease [Parenemella sanctibonifatiensis]|uniref:ABC transporter permease n=1 Tax=Parenemella sanctibonifatiensis TaxID=2016505 RepID=A0A255EGY9_9ACTN|nr:ABC-2 family transporter protein [Parenemella sanctibonifatiensis]OYN90809.1 ABC transporter permease [Parenemella sanctibonifatiensis]
MAERPAYDTLSTIAPSTIRLVWLLLVSRIRAQWQYRASFWADVLGQATLVPLEFLEVYVLLHAAPIYGGMSLAQAAALYGMTSVAFGMADLFFGQLDSVNRHIKRGTLEVILTRPLSPLVQLITQDLQLRRLGRVVTGLVLYLVALGYADVTWSVQNLALAGLAPVGGFIIFGALFLFASGTLFFVLDGNQAVNAFTYGGRYASSVPGSVLMTPVKVFFTFVVPSTLIAYVPTAVLTGAELPAFWWPGLAWLTIPIGLAMWLLLLGYWKLALRHYTGAGG